MGTGGGADEGQWRRTRQAIHAAGLTIGQVWIHYFGLTGEAGEFEVDAYLNGLLDLPSVQRDLLSHAVNELADGSPAKPRAPYCRGPEAEGPTEQEGEGP